MEYKLDLPETCPPKQAKTANLTSVYRLIGGDIITETDLISHVEEGKSFPPAKLCEAHAVSFFQDLKTCEILKGKFKNLRNKTICEGQLTKECGVMDLFLNESHINLWVYKDVNILSIFKGE